MTADQSFEIVTPDRPLTRSEGLAIVNLIELLWNTIEDSPNTVAAHLEFDEELSKLKEQLS